MKKFILTLILLNSIPNLAYSKDWDEYSQTQKEDVIVASAYQKAQQSNNQLDCSSFVSAVLSKAGHNLSEFSRSYNVQSNGVRLIHEYVNRMGNTFIKKDPRPGDLIFFSNTYDLNGDHQLGDKLTHVGIVTSVDEDGTISFLHMLRKKLKTGFMNLKKPLVYEENGKVFNSYLRRAQKKSSKAVLTSQLFDIFGSLNP